MSRITARIARELLAHEGIVQEAYLDSRNIWTWSVGVTNASGHEVYPRYKDNPQDLERCLGVYLWLLGKKYAPAVEQAFAGRELSEAQFGAALSFHYNTGAISTAAWVRQWLEGDTAGARKSIMNWKAPAEIVPRRQKERALFFDGVWSAAGKSQLYKVAKPTYKPANPRPVDIGPAIEALLGGG